MKFTILLLISFIPLMLYAHSPYVKESEPSVLEVIYSRKQITDTLYRNNYLVDDVLLRIGNKKSLFCGVKKLWEDSISTVDYNTYAALLKASYEKDKKNFFFLGGRYWGYIYKDYQKNDLIECDYFNMTHWKYEEPLQIPMWTVTDSVKNLLGYECIKATTSFKGRDWIAWFTPEIPISDGPWKLLGLPGLILEAYDANHEYEFIPQTIQTSGIAPVGFMWYTDENNHRKVSREDFLKEWRKYKSQDNASKVKAAYNLNLPTFSPSTSLIQYDREETDYPHE